MWWHFKKLVEDDAGVIYEYGYGSPELTGIIEHDKKTGDTVITQKAKGEPVNAEDWTLTHFYSAVTKMNYPDKTIEAIG